jgi:hypothetical protein
MMRLIKDEIIHAEDSLEYRLAMCASPFSDTVDMILKYLPMLKGPFDKVERTLVTYLLVKVVTLGEKWGDYDKALTAIREITQKGWEFDKELDKPFTYVASDMSEVWGDSSYVAPWELDGIIAAEEGKSLRDAILPISKGYCTHAPSEDKPTVLIGNDHVVLPEWVDTPNYSNVVDSGLVRALVVHSSLTYAEALSFAEEAWIIHTLANTKDPSFTLNSPVVTSLRQRHTGEDYSKNEELILSYVSRLTYDWSFLYKTLVTEKAEAEKRLLVPSKEDECTP